MRCARFMYTKYIHRKWLCGKLLLNPRMNQCKKKIITRITLNARATNSVPQFLTIFSLALFVALQNKRCCRHSNGLSNRWLPVKTRRNQVIEISFFFSRKMNTFYWAFDSQRRHLPLCIFSLSRSKLTNSFIGIHQLFGRIFLYEI